MSIKNHLKTAALGLVLSLAASGAFADVVAIVSAKSATASLTADEVANIFLGKSATFPRGGAAVPLDQSESSPQRDEFYNKTARKSAAQLKAYWSKIIFTGKGQPPQELPGNNEVKKAVAADPTAIGYIDKSALDSSVKVVLLP